MNVSSKKDIKETPEKWFENTRTEVLWKLCNTSLPFNLIIHTLSLDSSIQAAFIYIFQNYLVVIFFSFFIYLQSAVVHVRCNQMTCACTILSFMVCCVEYVGFTILPKTFLLRRNDSLHRQNNTCAISIGSQVVHFIL